MDLPKEFKGKIYFYGYKDFNMIAVSRHDMSDDADYIFLGDLDVDLKFSVTEEEAIKQVVKSLNAEKDKIKAQAQSDLNKLDEKINSLLAITHQSEAL